jgi:hypothetical protein
LDLERAQFILLIVTPAMGVFPHTLGPLSANQANQANDFEESEEATNAHMDTNSSVGHQASNVETGSAHRHSVD